MGHQIQHTVPAKTVSPYSKAIQCLHTLKTNSGKPNLHNVSKNSRTTYSQVDMYPKVSAMEIHKFVKWKNIYPSHAVKFREITGVDGDIRDSLSTDDLHFFAFLQKLFFKILRNSLYHHFLFDSNTKHILTWVLKKIQSALEMDHLQQLPGIFWWPSDSTNLTLTTVSSNSHLLILWELFGWHIMQIRNQKPHNEVKKYSIYLNWDYNAKYENLLQKIL